MHGDSRRAGTTRRRSERRGGKKRGVLRITYDFSVAMDTEPADSPQKHTRDLQIEVDLLTNITGMLEPASSCFL